MNRPYNARRPGAKLYRDPIAGDRVNSADRQRWGTAPAASTVPRIDWTQLLGVGCNRFLDGAPC